MPVGEAVGDVDEDLARERRGDEVGVTLDVDDGAELSQQRRGESVIRVDRDLSVRLDDIGERCADSVCQFLRCLVGERDAEDPLGFQAVVRDEVAHPLGDGRGLACSGTRSDPDRPEGRTDDRTLLGRGHEAGHVENASLPSGWTGHTMRTAQLPHASPGVGSHCSAPIAAPSFRIRSVSESRDDGSNARIHPLYLAAGCQLSAATTSPTPAISSSCAAASR